MKQGMLAGSLCVALLSGCTKFVQVQTDLVAQARRGISMTSESLNANQAMIDRYLALRRKALDDAFDADVIAKRDALTPEWVIESRKAYSVGLNALAAEQRSARDAQDSNHRTLEAIDQALQQLTVLQQLQTNWMKP